MVFASSYECQGVSFLSTAKEAKCSIPAACAITARYCDQSVVPFRFGYISTKSAGGGIPIIANQLTFSPPFLPSS